MCAHHRQNMGLPVHIMECHVPVFPDIYRIHPSSHPSPLATQNTSKITLTIFYNNHGHGQHRCPLCMGERERGGLVLLHMEP